MNRSQRLVLISQALMNRPGTLFSLGYFCERLGAAKSTVSEDLDLVGETFELLGLGRVESFPGAGGGVTYWPEMPVAESGQLSEELCRVLSDPGRILPGGFLYMTDLIFTPDWAQRFGRFFASRFRDTGADYVITVETKGIPLALMTARFLNQPLVVIRRDARVTEGPSLSISYLSGSTGRIQTMSLPRRALPSGSKVLLIDDFMKAGGTARGMLDLMAEFEARVVGLGVLVETAEPSKKLVKDHASLAILESVDEKTKTVKIGPGKRT